MNQAALILVVALAQLGCADAAPSAGTSGSEAVEPSQARPILEEPSLALRVTSDGDTVTVDVVFGRRPNREGPRVAEIWLEHDAGLTFKTASAGDATTRAGKQVVAQTPDARQVRVVLFAPGNVERVGDGILATLTFARTAPGAQSIRLVDRRPIFAPSDADLGVLIGPAVVAASSP